MQGMRDVIRAPVQTAELSAAANAVLGSKPNRHSRRTEKAPERGRGRLPLTFPLLDRIYARQQQRPRGNTLQQQLWMTSA